MDHFGNYPCLVYLHYHLWNSSVITPLAFNSYILSYYKEQNHVLLFRILVTCMKRINMKSVLLYAFTIMLYQQLMAQSDTSKIIEASSSSGRLWSVGFLIAFVIGIALYFIIKKNPKKDAVR